MNEEQPLEHRVPAAARLLAAGATEADVTAAVQTAQEAVRRLREGREDGRTAPFVLATCDLLEALGRLEEAAGVLRDAVERGAADPAQAAVLLKRQGITQERRGDADDALRTMRAATQAAQDSGDPALVADLHNSLSLALLNLGRLDEAAQAADRAIGIAVDLRDPRLASAATLTRGNVCMQSGQPLMALRHFHVSLLNSGELGDRRTEALQLTNIAGCYLQLGEVRLFVDYIIWALDTAIELNDQRHRALALINLAGVSAPLEARALYTEAWTLYVHLRDLPNQANALFGLARATRTAGQPLDALHFARQAAEAGAKMQSLELSATAHGLIAKLSDEIGDAEQAWTSYQSAWRSLETLRRQTAAETVQLGLAALSRSYEDGALGLALRQVLSADAAAGTWTSRLSGLLELSRARVMADLMGRNAIRAATLPDDVQGNLERHREAVRHRLADLAAARRSLPADDPRIAAIGADLDRLDRHMREAFAFAEQSYRPYRLLTAADPRPELDLLRHQEGRVALIQYAQVDGVLISVTRVGEGAEVVVHGPLADVVAMDRTLGELCGRCADEARAGDLASGLHDLMFAPIERTGILRDVAEIMVAPAPEVFGFPVEALRGAGGYVFERYTVTYVPGLSVAAAAPPMPADYRPALIIADPDGTLPFAGQEGAMVSDFLESPVLSGDAATKDALLQDIGDAALVHIAGHATFSDDAASFSSIVLAGDRAGTRRNLELNDVIGLRLRPSLVVLSGCETGRSSNDGSNEMIGFVRGFIASGAAAVVASRWLVRDSSTTQFMRQFYARLIDDAAHPAEALNAARRDHIAGGYTHPGLWAPFSHFGTPPGWRGRRPGS